MADKTNNELNQSIVDKHCNTCTCSCKIKKETKEYVKRAKRNYRLRKLENDTNYAENMKQKSKQYRDNNKEQYNESMRLYMQKYRAKKKAEKLAASSPIDSAMENLTIKDKSAISTKNAIDV